MITMERSRAGQRPGVCALGPARQSQPVLDRAAPLQRVPEVASGLFSCFCGRRGSNERLTLQGRKWRVRKGSRESCLRVCNGCNTASLTGTHRRT